MKKLSAATEWLRGEYVGIRTGAATVALLDSVKAESYGTFMALNQLSSISIEDARTLRLSPWDASTISAIERAITEADLGVSVATDSSGLRVIFPELTSERRVQILKLAKSKLEEARVKIRSARDEAMKLIDSEEKDGKISEDERFKQKNDVQKKVDNTNDTLDKLFSQKEAEISK